MTADLLLLNCSNLRSQPIYPYAFVQLRALAQTHGLRVEAIDFMGFAAKARRAVLREALGRFQPRMVGIHLRQADSVNFANYSGDVGGSLLRYFPLEDTQTLIKEVRQVTDQPVVVGGFGFTIAAPDIYDYLGADYGVRGEPDDFFTHFERLCAGQAPDEIENLVFRRDGAIVETRRNFYPPLNRREYDEAVVADLERFYGVSTLYGPDPPTVAVELARGCPYRCYFCTEPHVKGRRPRTRDLDVVFDEIEFLVSRALRSFWLVCSELNVGNADLALAVAERFIRLQEVRPGLGQVRWRAYHLPRWLSRTDLELLYRSGFEGGWNDFPSFDDDNLKATGMPYRSQDVLEHLKDTVELRPEGRGLSAKHFSLFLGNAYMTASALAATVRKVHELNFANSYRTAQIGMATRLFETLGEDVPEGAATVTFRSDGRQSKIDRIHPTFYLPASLVRAAGSASGLWDFFRYAQETLFSASYRLNLDWCEFLRTSTSPEWLSERLDEKGTWSFELETGSSKMRSQLAGHLEAFCGPDPQEAIVRVMNPTATSWEVSNQACFVLIRRLVSPLAPELIEGLKTIGLNWRELLEPWPRRFELLLALLERYESNDAAIAGMATSGGWKAGSLADWQQRYLLYDCNIVLRPTYRALLSPSEARGGAQGVDQTGLSSQSSAQ